MSSCWTEVGQLDFATFHFVSVSLLLGAVDILVVLGNGLVIVSVIIHRHLHTTTNFIISSLAISDLLLGLVVLPFSISQQMFEEVWPFGQRWCQMWLAADVWLCTASIYNLVAVSFDRFMAVRHPLKYRLISSVNMGRRLVILSWFVAFMISLPPLIAPFFTGDVESGTVGNGTREEEDCRCTPMNNDSGYIIYSAMGSFFIPLLLIIALNSGIYLTIKAAAQKRCNTLQSGLRSTTPMVKRLVEKAKSDSDHGSIEKQDSFPSIRAAVDAAERTRDIAETNSPRLSRRNESTQSLLASPAKKQTSRNPVRKNDIKKILRRAQSSVGKHRRSTNRTVRSEMRVAKTVGIVVGCFAICWLPFSVIYALQAYDICTMASGCIPNLVFAIAFWLGYCNSALNPIIYALFSRDLRWAFQRVAKKLRNICSLRKSDDYDSAMTSIAWGIHMGDMKR